MQPSEGKKMGMAFGLGCESGSGSGSGSGGGIGIGGEFLGWSLIIIIFSVLTRTGPDVKVVDYYITIKGESKENRIKIYCSSRGRHAFF